MWSALPHLGMHDHLEAAKNAPLAGMVRLRHDGCCGLEACAEREAQDELQGARRVLSLFFPLLPCLCRENQARLKYNRC